MSKDQPTLAELKKANAAHAAADTKSLIVVNLKDVKVRNVDFIWAGRLAYGKNTLLAGPAGQGKSQITCDIIARITTGAKWPFSNDKAPMGSCIVLSAEDGLEDTIKPRVLAAKGDPDKVHVIKATKDGKGERKFNLMTDLAALESLCKKIGDVVLIVIDPASSYMGGELKANSNTAVRSVLDPLNDFAERVNCAVLSITHFRKAKDGAAADRIMDSVAFNAAARVTFGVFEDKDVEEESHTLLCVKTNIGKMPKGLRYQIESVVGGAGLLDYRNNKPVETSRIKWLGETDVTADEATRAENARETPVLDEAVQFLRKVLDDGARDAAEVMAEGQSTGISEATLRRARDKLGVKTLRTRAVPPKTFWALGAHADFFESDDPSLSLSGDGAGQKH